MPVRLNQWQHDGYFLWMHPANEWRCYIVKSSLTGWAHTQNDPCNIGIADKDGPACWAATNTPYGEYWIWHVTHVWIPIWVTNINMNSWIQTQLHGLRFYIIRRHKQATKFIFGITSPHPDAFYSVRNSVCRSHRPTVYSVQSRVRFCVIHALKITMTPKTESRGSKMTPCHFCGNLKFLVPTSKTIFLMILIIKSCKHLW